MVKKNTYKENNTKSSKNIFNVLIKNTLFDAIRLKEILTEQAKQEEISSELNNIKRLINGGNFKVFIPIVPVYYLNFFQVYILKKVVELRRAGITCVIVLLNKDQGREEEFCTQKILENTGLVGNDELGLLLTTKNLYDKLDNHELIKKVNILYKPFLNQVALNRLIEYSLVFLHTHQECGMILTGEVEKEIHNAIIQLIDVPPPIRLYLPKLDFVAELPTLADNREAIKNKLMRNYIGANNPLNLFLFLSIMLLFDSSQVAPIKLTLSNIQKLYFKDKNLVYKMLDDRILNAFSVFKPILSTIEN